MKQDITDELLKDFFHPYADKDEWSILVMYRLGRELAVGNEARMFTVYGEDDLMGDCWEFQRVKDKDEIIVTSGNQRTKIVIKF